MTKVKFLMLLHERLAGLPLDEVEERLSFYSEMIDDRMEEGLSEEEAVAAIGTVDEIVVQIIADIPLTKIAMDKCKPKRRLRAGEILLLALGSPVWLSLLVAAVAVVFSLYISAWAVIASVWAVFVSLVGCAVGCIVGGIGFTVLDHALTGLAVIAAGLVCGGLAVFTFLGCRAVTKGVLILTKKTVLWMKKSFAKREGTV